jgi:hypothetical protein
MSQKRAELEEAEKAKKVKSIINLVTEAFINGGIEPDEVAVRALSILFQTTHELSGFDKKQFTSICQFLVEDYNEGAPHDSPS